MSVACRIAVAAVLVAALASCAEGPGAAPKPTLIGTWEVTSYIDEGVDVKDRDVTLIITATTYAQRYDPPLEIEDEDEDVAGIGIREISATYEADAEKMVLTLSGHRVDLVGEDSDLIELLANAILSEYPETEEVSYSFPESDRLRLENEAAGTTLIARRLIARRL